MRITGSWIAIPTSFKEDGTVDLEGFKKLIDFHQKYGTDGLIVLGSAGEASMLTTKEKQEIIEFVADYSRDKIPVLMGTTGPNTSETITLTKFAQEHKAYGALLIVPAYIRPPQEAIYNFFREVATAVDLPISIYNNPTRVGVNISLEISIRLAKIPNIIAFKEAIPEVNQLIELKKAVGEEVDILPCDSPAFSVILPCLAMGGSGVTNITGNLAPEEFAQLSKPWSNFEEVTRCRQLFFNYFELMKICYAVTNPVVIKAGLKLLGLPGGKPRPPLSELNPEKTAQLKNIMEKLGLLSKYKVKK